MMRCPQCGTENPEGAKFCMDCGARMPLLCPQCGAVVPLQARFCVECGGQLCGPPRAEEPGTAAARALRRLAPREFAERLLATRGQVAGERRIVTMLFSDVKGSTPMAEHLDPEDVLEIMDGAFDMLIEPITRYEGALARLMGDGILAFFGAPIAHEDDAERACRAALGILEGARGYAARLEAERGIAGFNVRVGIHTGLVVVGEVGSDLRVEYTAMGDAVNLASRMEEAAAPGTALITEDTHRLIAPLFETEALGPMEVRGRGEPVSVYRVLAPRVVAGKPRGIEGLESPLVGRDAEFAALQDALRRLKAGVGGIVTIVGEAGIGKSRLVAELRKEAAPLDVRWVEGRCLSYGESMAYLPFLEMLHGLLGTSAEDAPLAVRDALREWVEGLCPDDFNDVYPFLGRMMSLPPDEGAEARLQGIEPDGLKVLTFRAMERVVEAAAGTGALVLVCEDLHWADATSLELLEELMGLTDRASLLLVFAFRPHTEHGCWAIRERAARLHRYHYTDLWLQSLSPADSEELVGNLLEVEALPRPLRRRILDHAEGNPFYVEEVIRSLIDSEVLFYDDATSRWQAAREVEDIAIPDTLQGVLTSRIDRLEEGARRVLQMASVIGRIFLRRILVDVAEGEADLDTQLLVLQREEMIRQRARVPELEYIFKHHLTQEAAYDGLLRRERRRIHREVGEAWERLFAGRLEEQLGLLAYHWEGAGERQRAVGYLRRAGEQAAARYANEEAVGYFGRALDLTPVEDLAERYELLLDRERVYRVQGTREAQGQDVAALQELAETLDDDHMRAEVAYRQALYAYVIDYPATIAAAQRAVRLAEALGDVRMEARGYGMWAWALYWQGEYNSARSKARQRLRLARAAHLQREEASGLHVLSQILHLEGDFVGERACLEESERIYREVGERRWENVGRCWLGELALAQGDCDEARVCYQHASAAFREIGDRWHEGWAYLLPGRVYHYLGDYDKARGCYDRALRSCCQLGDRRGELMALTQLGLLSHEVSDDEVALQFAERALKMGREQGDRYRQAASLVLLGHALVARGRLDSARDAYRQALALLQELGLSRRTVDALAGLARVCVAQGDLSQARAHVEEMLNYLEPSTLLSVFEPGEPCRVYLTCHRALWANGDPRADGVLEEGYRLLEERAAKISNEEERRSYLENVAANREIVEAWASRCQTKPIDHIGGSE